MVHVLSVDVGTRHLAWFSGELIQFTSSIECAAAAAPLDNPPIFKHVHRICDDKNSEWHVMDIVPSDSLIQNVNEARVEDLVPWLQSAFTQNKHKMLYVGDFCVERVYIEQQPMGIGVAAARNIKTKVLSHVLQALILQEFPNMMITFVSPRIKLRHASLALGKTPETYADNKRAAKKLTPILLKKLSAPKLLTTFEQRKGKKDDLADSLLQAIYAFDDECEALCKLEQKMQKQNRQINDDVFSEPIRAIKKKRVKKIDTAVAAALILGNLP